MYTSFPVALSHILSLCVLMLACAPTTCLPSWLTTALSQLPLSTALWYVRGHRLIKLRGSPSSSDPNALGYDSLTVTGVQGHRHTGSTAG